jgi:hypothetical protein
LCEDSPEDIARAISEGLMNAEKAGQEARRTIPQPWSKIMTDVIRKYEFLIDQKNKEK